MKKVISAIMVTMLIIGSLLPISSVSVFAETANKDYFATDFSSADGWTGDTSYINVEKGFGSNDGWATTVATITTEDCFDFGDTFNASFEMFTDYANGSKINPREDYQLTIGKFKIALCDFQSRIKVYYDGTDIGGTSTCSNMNYVSPITRHYNVHIEPGNIKITSERVTYTSTFALFDPIDNAAVSLKKCETWEIYTAYIDNLKIAKQSDSFVADFTSVDNWSGLTDYVDTANNKFATNKAWDNKTGTLTTVNSYYFGNTVDAGFKIFTDYANGAYYDAGGLKQPGFDFSFSIGKFQICLCDYLTRIVVKYDGNTVTGTSTCSDYSYKTAVTRGFDVHIEPGYISVESGDVSYFSDFSDFEPLDNATVTIGVHETWQIAGFKFSDVFVKAADSKYEVGDVNTSGKIDATDIADLRNAIVGKTANSGIRYDLNRDGNIDILDLIRLKKILAQSLEEVLSEPFTADFTSKDGWTGYTDNINTEKGYFGTNTGWSNAKGTITSKDTLTLGKSFIAEFALFTGYANGNPASDRFVLNIGDFKVEVSAFQNKIALYYKGEELAKATKDTYTYAYDKSYTYSLYVIPGNITLVQYTSDGKSVLYVSSDLADYEKLSNAEVSLSNFEDWEIWTGYFSNLTIEPTVPNATSLVETFDSLDNWNGDVSFISAEGFGERKMWSDKTRKITSNDKFDFSKSFDVSFKLYTSWSNGDKINVSKDFIVNVGDFEISVWDFQTRMKIAYNGTDIGGTCVCPTVDYVSPRTCHYNVHIEPGNITVTSEKLTYTSDFAAFIPQNNVTVSLQKNTTWQINAIFIDDLSVSKSVKDNSKTVTVNSTENGTVTACVGKAEAGDTVALTVRPAENFQLKLGSLCYSYTEDDVEKNVLITDFQGTDTYSFVMPDADVTVSALFEAAGTIDAVILSIALDSEDAANATGITVTAAVNKTSDITECGVAYDLGNGEIELTAASTSALQNGTTEFTVNIPVENWYGEITLKPYAVIGSTRTYGEEKTVSMNSIAGFTSENYVVSSVVESVNSKKN